MLEISKVFLVFGVVLTKCYLGSTEIFDVDVSDILDERFMPVSLFLQDVEFNINNTRKHFYQTTAEGDFSKALTTMGYHRQMMNEYLCSNFVVDEIIRDLAPQIPHIERRMGIATKTRIPSNTSIYQKQRTGKSIHQEALLFDQGSTGYQNWLQKSTTLDDIQQQIKQQNSENQTKSLRQSNQLSTPLSTNRRQYQGNDEDDFYEEGDITGYAMNKPLRPEYTDYSSDNNRDTEGDFPPQRSANIHKSVVPENNLVYVTYPQHTYYHQNYEHTSNPYQTYATDAEGSHAQTHHQEGHYQGGQEVYDHDHGVQQHQAYVAPSYNVQDYGQGKELGIKDFIDIALTTLAFLSFGMFILQVLMCITMNKNNNNLMMMPMEIDSTVDQVEEIRRKRSLENKRIREVNEISRRVLVSIEAILHAKVDDGECLQRAICTDNKYARGKKDGRRIWMPVWSLGLSWLSARFVPARTSITSALNNLKAAAIGLGGGSCEHFYPSCNFQNILDEKRSFWQHARKGENIKFEWSV